MLRSLFLLLVFSSSSLFAQGSLEKAAEHPLWQKALNLSAASAYWLPGQLNVREVVKNKSGGIQESIEVNIHLSADQSGEVQFHLASFHKNGEDISEKQRKTFSEYRDYYLPALYDFDPLAVENQELLTLNVLAKTREIAGKECRGFTYTAEMNGEEKQGAVWLDVEKGYPRLIEISYPDSEEDDILASNIKSATHFHITPNGQFYPIKEIMTMDLKAAALFFKWKGSNRIETQFQEYVHLN